MEFLWCIEHECFELVQNSPVGILHEYEVSTEFGLELDFCDFPCGYSTCPPPEYEENWQDNLISPNEDEIISMNLESSYLFSDYISEVVQYERNFPKPL